MAKGDFTRRQTLMGVGVGGASAMASAVASAGTRTELSAQDTVPMRAEILDRMPAITWHGAVGDDSTDNTRAIQAALDSNPRATSIYVPPTPGAYRVTGTIQLNRSQRLVGASNASILPIVRGNHGRSVINFRPSGPDTCVTNKPDSTTEFDGEGCGVEDLVIDMNRDDSFGIALSNSYSNAIRRVGLRGTYDVGIFLDSNYASLIEDVSTNGASVRHNIIYIGSQNITVVRRLHTSNYPGDAAVPLVGIAIAGGSGARIDDCQFQGVTIGIDANACSRTLVTNPYFENALCYVRAGIAGAICSHFIVKGGVFEPVVPPHPQYASRGPGFYFANARNWDLDGVYFGLTHAADAKFWPIVLGDMGAAIGTGSFRNTEALHSLILNEIARIGTTTDWSLRGSVSNSDNRYAGGELFHVNDAHNSRHRLVTVNDAGRPAFRPWQPADGAAVGGLLSTPFFTPNVP